MKKSDEKPKKIKIVMSNSSDFVKVGEKVYVKPMQKMGKTKKQSKKLGKKIMKIIKKTSSEESAKNPEMERKIVEIVEQLAKVLISHPLKIEE